MQKALKLLRKVFIDDDTNAFIAQNRVAVSKENLMMLRRLSALGTGIICIMTALCFMLPYLYRMQALYPRYCAGYVVICALSFTLADKRRLYLILCAAALVVITTLFGIDLGVYHTLDANANLFMVFLIVLPMLFIISPHATMICALVSCAVFTVLTIKVKPPRFYEIDVTNCWVCYVISMISARMISDVRIENIDARRRLYSDSMTDGLTHLNNRRAFNEYIASLHREILTGKTRAVVYMIDVDLFKLYNDRYGHVEGDDCLVALARALTAVCDSYGLYVARYGGEEFVAVSTSAALPAKATGLAIVNAVYDCALPFSDSPYGRVTVSVGCADTRAGGGENDFDLINNADKALYAAKENGRNRFEFYKA